MKTLIIYDQAGEIIMTQSGDGVFPELVAMLVTDIPDGKHAVSVDVETGEAVLEDIPKSDTELRIEQLEATVNAMLGEDAE